MEACAFAGTGNVLKVQAMLHHCDEHIVEKEKDEKKDEKKEENKESKEEAKPEVKQDDTFQAFSVLAVALIAMGEEIGAEMSLRQFNHLVSLSLLSLLSLIHSIDRCTMANLSFANPYPSLSAS